VNIELYIQSGVVESYAFGLATPREAAELEQLLPHYPELRGALADFEYQLELFAIDHEIPPPPGTREKIEYRLGMLPAVRPTPRDKGDYSGGRPYGGSESYNKSRQPEYISVESSSTHIWVHKSWRAWFIVFCLLSKIFIALFVYYFVEYRFAQKQILQLEEQLGKKEQVKR
jgi:hypothetical protein